MPRISRAKARHHASAAQLPTEHPAVEQRQPNAFSPNGLTSQPTEQVIDEPSQASSSRQRFIIAPSSEHLPLSSQPYSRSHERRLKRRKNQNAAVGVHPLAAALAESLGETEAKDKVARVRTKAEKQAAAEKQRRDADEGEEGAGMIGEGGGKTLKEKRRREVMLAEAKRREAVLQHPEFKQDPWATIRLHAGNSIAVKGNGNAETAKVQRPRTGTNKGAMEVDS